VLVERSMGELNEERKPVYPLFKKGASMSLSMPNTRNPAGILAPVDS
jgi:hypothetical protein